MCKVLRPQGLGWVSGRLGARLVGRGRRRLPREPRGRGGPGPGMSVVAAGCGTLSQEDVAGPGRAAQPGLRR